MDAKDRRCGNCGHLNLPTSEFCDDCGVFLSSVQQSTLLRTRQTQFALPDYLLMAREREREERRRRLSTETGDGVGLLWVGVVAALLAIWFGGGIGLGAPLFLISLLAILLGLWRLRRDARNMARAGTATVVVSSMVLGAALAQTLGFSGSDVSEPLVRNVTPIPTADAQEVAGEDLLPGAEVPMFRGNAARTGENPGPAPRARPLVRWKSFIGGESYASPVIGNDKVFVATKTGSVVALELKDGREVWRADVGDYIARSTPALHGDTLFVTSGYAILAIDSSTGKERWSKPLRFAGSCSPVVNGDLVYVATQEGHVSAFASETGEEVWHYRNDNLLFGSPAIEAETLVIADEVGRVTAIDANSGRELWQKDAGGEAFATPAIAKGVVYVATTEPGIVAFDLATGHEEWRRDVGGSSSPAVVADTIYLGGDDQSVRALDTESGDTEWSVPLGYAIESSASVSDAIVFIASGPTITALDRKDGRTLWSHVTGGDVSSDVVVANNLVVTSSHDGYVYALGPSGAGAENGGALSNTNGGVLLQGSR